MHQFLHGTCALKHQQERGSTLRMEPKKKKKSELLYSLQQPNSSNASRLETEANLGCKSKRRF